MKLPPRMHGKTRYWRTYYYHVSLVDGRRVWTPLGRDLNEARLKWAQLEGELERTPGTADVNALLDRYAVEVLPEKAPRTQADYKRYMVRVRAVFGEMPVRAVRRSHVAQYLRRHPAPVAANREVAMLSAAYQHAIYLGWAEANPCRGAGRNRERPRKRAVLEQELEPLWTLPELHPVRLACELVLLTALRRGDVLRLQRSGVKEYGLRVTVHKSSTEIVYSWTPKLRELVDRCKRMRGALLSTYLLCNKRGQRYTDSGFDSIRTRVFKALDLDFTMHDLRAYALTQAASKHGRDYAQKLAAHADGSVTERYIRGRELQTVEPIM